MMTFPQAEACASRPADKASTLGGGNRMQELADELMFLVDQLGVKYRAVGPTKSRTTAPSP